VTSSLPGYAVPDVVPVYGTDGLAEVCYRGHQLATCAPVARVLDRVPAILTTVEEAWPGHTLSITRAELCGWLFVSTRDGLHWGLSFPDAVGYLVQGYQSRHGSDPELLTEALVAQPDVDSAHQQDTEYVEVRMARVHRADEMLARWLDAIITAHRGFARHRGVDLPY
jgi:hypothetical protein